VLVDLSDDIIITIFIKMIFGRVERMGNEYQSRHSCRNSKNKTAFLIIIQDIFSFFFFDFLLTQAQGP